MHVILCVIYSCADGATVPSLFVNESVDHCIRCVKANFSNSRKITGCDVLCDPKELDYGQNNFPLGYVM